MGKITPACAYCGTQSRKLEREHVIPGCLYPASRAASRVQRLTVPACRSCNGAWADDEAHFRNVLLLAGDSNTAGTELWEGPAARGLNEVDGLRRLRDLVAIMKPITVDGQPRHTIYPASDDRVLRIVRKVVRGLCYHHDLAAPIADEQLWADVMRYAVPPVFLDEMAYEHREPDVLAYRFATICERDLHSAWLLTFYERTTFIVVAWVSEAARARAEENRDGV